MSGPSNIPSSSLDGTTYGLPAGYSSALASAPPPGGSDTSGTARRKEKSEEVYFSSVILVDGIEMTAAAFKIFMEFTGKMEIPSLFLPRLPITGGSTLENMNDDQRLLHGELLLIKGGVLFAINLKEPSLPIPDDSFTNHTIEDIAGYKLPDDVQGLFSGGLVRAFSGKGSEIMDPMALRQSIKDLVANHSDYAILRGVGAAYAAVLSGFASAEFNRHSQTLQGFDVSPDDYRVGWVIKQSGGVPDGMTESEWRDFVAELITSYQDSGDFGAHAALFNYAREEWGIDLENEDDPMAFAIVGAAQNAERVSPDSALMALFNTLEVLAKIEEFKLGKTASAYAQTMVRSSFAENGLGPNLASAGAAALLAGVDFATIKVTGGKLTGETTGVIFLQQGAGWLVGFAAQNEDGSIDYDRFKALDKSSNELASFMLPYALAGLSYSNTNNYEVVVETGKVVDEKQNGTMMGLTAGTLGGAYVNDLSSAWGAGKYTQKFKESKDIRDLIPLFLQSGGLAAEIASSIYYSTKNTLPDEAVKDYENLVTKLDNRADFKGNDPVLLLGAAGGAVLANSLGFIAGYFWGVVDDDSVSLNLEDLSPSEVDYLIAQAIVDSLHQGTELANMRPSARDYLGKSPEEIAALNQEYEIRCSQIPSTELVTQAERRLADARTRVEMEAADQRPRIFDRISALRERVKLTGSLQNGTPMGRIGVSF